MVSVFFKRVLPGVWTGTEYRTILRFPFNMVIVQVGEQLTLIDPLQPDEAGFRELEAHGRPATVLLTSANHERAAALYRERYGARVLAHANAIPECEGHVDGTLTDGETLPGDIAVLALPGTMAGMVAFRLQRTDGLGVLVVGDVLMYDDFAERSWLARLAGSRIFLARDREVTPFPLKWMDDQAAARHSLQRLQEQDFDALLVTHGIPLLAGAKAAVARNLPA